MDSTSRATDLQTFYQTAAQQRWNPQEESVILDCLTQKIAELERQCRKLATRISDPNNQDVSLSIELKQKRTDLAYLYVKHVFLTHKEEVFFDTPKATAQHPKSQEKTPNPPATVAMSSSSSGDSHAYYSDESGSPSYGKQISYTSTSTSSSEHYYDSINPVLPPASNSSAVSAFNKTILNQHFIDTAEAIVNSAIEEHVKQNAQESSHSSYYEDAALPHNGNSMPNQGRVFHQRSHAHVPNLRLNDNPGHLSSSRHESVNSDKDFYASTPLHDNGDSHPRYFGAVNNRSSVDSVSASNFRKLSLKNADDWYTDGNVLESHCESSSSNHAMQSLQHHSRQTESSFSESKWQHHYASYSQTTKMEKIYETQTAQISFNGEDHVEAVEHSRNTDAQNFEVPSTTATTILHDGNSDNYVTTETHGHQFVLRESTDDVPGIILSTPPNEPTEDEQDEVPGSGLDEHAANQINDIFEITMIVEDEGAIDPARSEVTADLDITIGRYSEVEETVLLEAVEEAEGTFQAVSDEHWVYGPEEVVYNVYRFDGDTVPGSVQAKVEDAVAKVTVTETTVTNTSVSETIDVEHTKTVTTVPAQPRRMFNNYSDLDYNLENKTKTVSYGNGYEHFKKIERQTLEDDGVADSSVVRASTDNGWHTPEPVVSSTPVDENLSIQTESELIVQNSSTSPHTSYAPDQPLQKVEHYEEHRHLQREHVSQSSLVTQELDDVSVSTKTPSPTFNEAAAVFSQTSVSERHSTSKTNSYRYGEWRRSQLVDSPAFSPISPDEEGRQLTPSASVHSPVQKPISPVTDVPSPSKSQAVKYKPVQSKIFTIPQGLKTDSVMSPVWVEEEEKPTKSPEQESRIIITQKPLPRPVNFTPMNRTMLFDDSVNVSDDFELMKVKRFKQELERQTDTTSHVRHQYQPAEIYTPSTQSTPSPSTQHSYSGPPSGPAYAPIPFKPASHHRDWSMDLKHATLRSSQTQPQVECDVPASPARWQRVEQRSFVDQALEPHEVEHVMASSKPKAHIGKIKVTKTTGTIYSAMKNTSSQEEEFVDDAENLRQAVMQAAEKKVIGVKIPRSPVTTTPPSTPVVMDPFENSKGPAPKGSRSIFKQLEKSVAEDVRREQPDFRREREILESKKVITEESLRHPGRRPKNGHSIFVGTEEVAAPAGRKYFIQTTSRVSSQSQSAAGHSRVSPEPVLVNRASPHAPIESQPQSHNVASETPAGLYHHHQLPQSPTFRRIEEQLVASPAPVPASTATYHAESEVVPRVKSPKVVKQVRFAPIVKSEPNVEDFRRSKVFTHITEAARKRHFASLEEQVHTAKPTVSEAPSQAVVYEAKAPKVPHTRYQRPAPKPSPPVVEPDYDFRYLQPPILHSSRRFYHGYTRMPEMEDGFVDADVNGFLNKEESDVTRNWDPTELVQSLYAVDYSPKIEQKRSRFRNMEGHLEIPNDEVTVPEVEKEWKKVYFRTKDSRLQWFATNYADEHPIGDILLSDAEINTNKEECKITVIPKNNQPKIVVKTPSDLFEKWRQALLSHRESTIFDSFVQPVAPMIPHYTDKVALIELGSCSIRAGVLTHKPSLPQCFFPALGCVTESGEVFVGTDALRPDIRHNGQLQRPIDAVDHSVERYRLNKAVLHACLKKVIADLKIDPSKFTVLLSIPQNIPGIFISQLMRILIEDNGFHAASIARQPSLILYSYDVTTGVVVDIGERLNIVPVIDEYIVESAIVSLPFGAQQIRDSLRQNLKQRNNGLYSYQSPIEHALLRYAVEHTCYVSTDFDEENQRVGSSSEANQTVNLDGFKLAPGMESKFTVDRSRFHAPEGLFQPKRWNLEVKGLHQLINDAIQHSPIDSRRTLYKNIYLCGGTSLLHGMAERIENELAKLVPGTIRVQVHMSPWRYHAAYLGAQVIASGKLFSRCCATKDNLEDYLKQLETTSYANGN